MMRVITGKAKGVRLDAPAGERTRPTSERSKEAMFSMIQFEIEGRRVLDLFAGSGQLGIEAVSRGAVRAVFVDSSREATEIVRKNLNKTKTEPLCEVICGDWASYLNRCRERFDLVLLDPPYALGVVPKVLSELTRRKLLIRGALILCETGSPDDVFGKNEKLVDAFELRRQVKHGVAYLTLLEWRGEENREDEI